MVAIFSYTPPSDVVLILLLLWLKSERVLRSLVMQAESSYNTNRAAALHHIGRPILMAWVSFFLLSPFSSLSLFIGSANAAVLFFCGAAIFILGLVHYENP